METMSQSACQSAFMLPYPAQKVWDAVSDFAKVDHLFDGVSVTEVIGTGIGMLRVVRGADGTDYTEMLDAIDPRKRTMSYHMTESSVDLSFSDYNATIKITPEGSDKCWFEYGSRQVIKRGAEQLVNNFLADAFTRAIIGARRFVERQSQ